jgi:hypothetical protein
MKEGNSFGDLRVSGKIKFKWILEKKDEAVKWIRVAKGRVQ